MGPMAGLTRRTVMTRRSVLLTSLAGLAVAGSGGLTGCSPLAGGESITADENLVRADVPRAPSSPVANSAESLAEFTGSMLSHLADGQTNLICSPLSVAMVLAMVRNGAASATAAEIDKTLGAGVGRVNSDMNAALHFLAGATGTKKSRGQEGEVTINLANSVWGQRDFDWQQSFLEPLAANFDTGVRLADLAGDPAAAFKRVNEWVAQQTENEITELLNPQQSPSGLVLILVNALLFRAQWTKKFTEPFDHPFEVPGKPPAPSKAMLLDLKMPGGTGQGWRGCMIPYVGGELSMTIILPDPEAEAAVIKNIAAGGLPKMQATMTERTVKVQLPEFEIDTSAELNAMLKTLGMKSAFSSVADFTSMTEDHRHIDISQVVHQATITVDREGTSAAAATAAVAPVSAPVPSQPMEVIADRPFWFFIGDTDCRLAPLFAGRLGNPSAKSD